MIKLARNLEHMLRNQQPNTKSSSLAGLIGRQALLGVPLSALGGIAANALGGRELVPLGTGLGLGLGFAGGGLWYAAGMKDRLKAQKQEILAKKRRGEKLTDTDKANLKYLESEHTD